MAQIYYNPSPAQKTPYNGLQDYGALKQQSDQGYADENAQLNDPSNTGDQFKTLDLISNSINSQSPMAPWFQALKNQGVNSVKAKPSSGGLGNDPSWWAQDTGGPYAPTIDSVPASLRPFFNSKS